MTDTEEEEDPYLRHDPHYVQALEWLRSPDLMSRLLEAMTQADARTDFLVGEDENAQMLLLENVARQSVLVDGASSGGKNTLVDRVCSIMPPSWVERITGLTEKAIRWLPEGTSYHTLYIAELRGLRTGEEESTSEFDMKVNISEGEIVILYPEKNDDGKLETKKRRVKVDQYILTSAEGVSQQLANRLAVLHIHDEEAQTKKVIDAQLKKKAQRYFTDYAEEVKVARVVMGLVLEKTEDLDVLIPFAESLRSIIPDDRTSNRRESQKLCRLISASAKLHYMARPILVTEGKRQIAASVDDLWNVLQVAGSNLRQTLGAVTDRQKEFLDLARTVQPLTIPEVSKAARQKKLSGLYLQSTLRKLAASLREKGIFIPQADEEGNEKKGYHGAVLYQIVPGSEDGVVFNNEKIILDAWAKLQECEYVSPGDYVVAIDSGNELAPDSASGTIVTAGAPTAANVASDTIATEVTVTHGGPIIIQGSTRAGGAA